MVKENLVSSREGRYLLSELKQSDVCFVMYLEYFVRVPTHAGLRSCRDAHALLAQLRERAAVPEQFDLRLLHLQSDGRPRHAPAAIRIGMHGRSIRISAVGTEAVHCVQKNAPRVGALVARHFGGPLQETHRAGECELHLTPRICDFEAPSLVLSRRNFDRPDGGFSFRNALNERQYGHPMLIEQVSRVLKEGIHRQANLCILDPPPLLIGDIKVHHLAPVRVKKAVHFLLGSISFRAGLRFVGPWHVGYLQSRGYGCLYAVSSKAARKFDDNE